MTATGFFWSAGHIGWPLFGIIVFSVLWLLAIDVVWRIFRMPFRKLLTRAVLIWVVGVVAIGSYLS